MAHERAAEFVGRASDNVQSARGQVGLVRNFSEAQSRQRSPWGGFENYCVPGSKSGRDFPGSQKQRKIPGHDGGDNSYGLAKRVMEKWSANRNCFAVNFCGPTGVVAEDFRHHWHINLAGLENRLAIIESLKRAELFVVLVNQVANFPESEAAIGCAHFR